MTRALLSLSLALAFPLGAQGTPSVQGYGYPTGQLGSRAQSTAGALAEVDEGTPLNPAAIVRWTTPAIQFQYEPEFRRTRLGDGGTLRTTTNRFPSIFAAFPAGGRLAFSLSLSQLLDRTFETVRTTRQLVGAESLFVSEQTSVEGGMSDVRVAGAYAATKWLAVGLGLHGIAGSNRFDQRVAVSRSTQNATTDTTGAFNRYRQITPLRFTGSAISLGVELRPLTKLAVGASARLGNSLRMEGQSTAGTDSTIALADVPDRFGLGASFEVAARTVLAAEVEQTRWSALAPLSRGSQPRDAVSYAVGLETPGPRLLGRALTLRGGLRSRELAYEAPDGGTPSRWVQVTERSATLGMMAPFAFNRANLHLFVQRAARDVAAETAYTVGLGLTVHP